MSNKPFIEVDEDMLRDAMLEVPAMKNRRPAGAMALLGEAVPEQPAPTPEPPEPALIAPVPAEPGSAKRGPYRKKRHEEGESYRDLFLANDGICSRVSTYINRDTHETIKRILSNAAPGISIVSYINNILRHHLEQNQEIIEELYRTGIDKPLLS